MSSSDTRPLGGSFTLVEDAEALENTAEAFPLDPRSIYANQYWTYSATMEDVGIAGALDGQPGLKYHGPSGTFIMGFDGLDLIEGTITGEATDEVDVAVYINSVDTHECDEADTEFPTGEAALEFNMADKTLNLETGDVVRVAYQSAASNEDDIDWDWGIASLGKWSIRPTRGASAVSTGVNGALYFSSASATTIATAGTPVKAAGTTAAVAGYDDVTDSNLLTIATTNRLTYADTTRRRCLVTFSGALSQATVENTTLRCAASIYRNGIAVTGAEVGADVEAHGRGAVTVSAVIELGEGDYIEVFVSNEEDTSNVTVQQGVLSVQSL